MPVGFDSITQHRAVRRGVTLGWAHPLRRMDAAAAAAAENFFFPASQRKEREGDCFPIAREHHWRDKFKRYEIEKKDRFQLES